MKNLRRILPLLCLTLLFLFLTACVAAVPTPDMHIPVLLRLTDENGETTALYVQILPGEDAVFDLAAENVFPLTLPQGATYDEENGTLTLAAVRYPRTADVSVLRLSPVPGGEKVRLFLRYDDTRGRVSYERGSAYMTPGVVTLRADVQGNNIFRGWSRDGYLASGGTLVSEEPTYTFYLRETGILYANFSAPSYRIIYHANGGSVAATGADTFTVTAPYKAQFPMQQTLHESGIFTRPGYVAVGYTTSPATYGTASVNTLPDFSNMGGVCSVPDTGELHLYVVWARETPAAAFTVKNGIITACTSTDPLLVIPAKIGGQTVRGIAAGAVSGNYTRVVIPASVTTLADGAFRNCSLLTEVVFFDAVTTLSDASFTSCQNIRTVVLNSSRLPRYSGGYEGTFCIKYERLRTLKGKKLILVAGSSALEGLDSAAFERNFPGYSVINFGTIAAYSMYFQLDVISKYTTSGDIVIHAPEYTMSQSMGAPHFEPKIFRGFEQCYDIFREVDMREYNGFFTAFSDFQNGVGIPIAAKDAPGQPYQTECEFINKYGDYTIDRTVQTSPVGSKSYGFNTSVLYYEDLNRINRRITARGGTLLMSFCPMDITYMSDRATDAAACRAFRDFCQEKLNYPVISDPGTYMMEHKYFFDSAWHLNEAGAAVRTANLTADLKKYLASAG